MLVNYGLIYKVTSYKENDLILHVFTKSGKITYFSKNASNYKTKNNLFSHVLSLISFELTPKNNLINIKLINDFASIKSNLSMYKNASIILEVIDKLIIENHDACLFYLICDTLKNLTNTELICFLYRLMSILGFKLNLTKNKEPISGISVINGGISNDNIDLSLEKSLIFVKIILKDNIILENQDYDLFKKFFSDYIKFHFNVKINSLLC